LIQSKLTWVPGNGKSMNIWSDKILENPPLETIPEISTIKPWFLENELVTLSKLLIWDGQTQWLGWKHFFPPMTLSASLEILFKHLAKCASMDYKKLDEWRWDFKGLKYVVKEGYNSLLQDLTNSSCSCIWKYIWKGNLLPKINVFTWVIAHGRLLTIEKL
jgi:hypothetical protein